MQNRNNTNNKQRRKTIRPDQLRSSANPSVRIFADQAFSLKPGRGVVRGNQTNVLLKDAIRGLTFNNEAFQNSDEFINLSAEDKDPAHTAYEDAFKLFLQKVWLTGINNKEAFLHIYVELIKSYSQQIWKQFHDAIATTAPLHYIDPNDPNFNKFDAVTVDDKWSANFYMSKDGTIHVSTILKDVEIIYTKFDDEGKVASVEKTQIPGEIHAEFSLDDQGFKLDIMETTTDALTAFIYERKVDVKAALATRPFDEELKLLESSIKKDHVFFTQSAAIYTALIESLPPIEKMDYQDEVKIRNFISALTKLQTQVEESHAALRPAFLALPDTLREAVKEPTQFVLIQLISLSANQDIADLKNALEEVNKITGYIDPNVTAISDEFTKTITEQVVPLSAEEESDIHEITTAITALVRNNTDAVAREKLQAVLKKDPFVWRDIQASARKFLLNIIDGMPLVLPEKLKEVSRFTQFARSQDALTQNLQTFANTEAIIDNAGSNFMSRAFEHFDYEHYQPTSGLFETIVPVIETDLAQDATLPDHQIKIWRDLAIAIAMDDLFDHEGHIKPDLFNLLNAPLPDDSQPDAFIFDSLKKLIFVFGEENINRRLLAAYVGTMIGTGAANKIAPMNDEFQDLPAASADPTKSPIAQLKKATTMSHGVIKKIDSAFITGTHDRLLAAFRDPNTIKPLKEAIVDYSLNKKLKDLAAKANAHQDPELKAVVFETVKLARNYKYVPFLVEFMPLLERYINNPLAHAREVEALTKRLSGLSDYKTLSEKLTDLQFATANRILNQVMQDPNVSAELKAPARLVIESIHDLDAIALTSHKLLLSSVMMQSRNLIVKSSDPTTSMPAFNKDLKAFGELMKQVTEPKPLQKVAGAMLCVAGAVLMLSPLIVFATLGPLGILAAPLAKIGMSAMIAGLVTLGLTGAPMVAKGGYGFFQGKAEAEAKSSVKSKMGSFMKESAQSYRDAHRKDDAADDKNNKPKP